MMNKIFIVIQYLSRRDKWDVLQRQMNLSLQKDVPGKKNIPQLVKR